MPGSSYSGVEPDFSERELRLSEVLRQDINVLAEGIGERNLRRLEALDSAAGYIESRLESIGWSVRRHSYWVGDKEVFNLEVIVPGHSQVLPPIVLGAHYDTAWGTPGANDNGSGVAVLLSLARRYRARSPVGELRLLWFTNEEPPHFQTENMGSLRYARELTASGVRPRAMVSLETLGYFDETPGSQQSPEALWGLLPSEGNFLAFVGDTRSQELVRAAVASFRAHAAVPSEGVAVSSKIQGIGWSDHWSFWQVDVPALMVTDTAPFRYRHYHKETDTKERIDYRRLARITDSLPHVIDDLFSKP